jgi:hypothetical protein
MGVKLGVTLNEKYELRVFMRTVERGYLYLREKEP